jgi:hypothetical protein
VDRAAVNKELEVFLASEEGPRLVAYFSRSAETPRAPTPKAGALVESQLAE